MTEHLVYKTTNLVNGKYYIGVHSCKCNPCRYLGSGVALKSAIKKYGRESFTREILSQFFTREEALKYEEEIVNPTDCSNYNLTKGGSGGTHNPDSIVSMVNSLTGRKHTQATKEAISKGNKGKFRSQEFKDNMRKLRLGTKLTEVQALKHKKTQGVRCYVKNKTFLTKMDAAKFHNISVPLLNYRLKSSNYPDYQLI